MKTLAIAFLAVLTCFGTVSGNQHQEIKDYLRRQSISIETKEDFDVLIERIGDSPIVLLGEASHGTSEYYRLRSQITQRLISEKGFNIIAVEGDWNSCEKVNKYIKQLPGSAENAEKSLKSFTRWPQWMWNNKEVSELIKWLRKFNDQKEQDKKVGFYGLDLYAMPESLTAVAEFVHSNCEELGGRIKAKYECLSRFKDDPRMYAHFVRSGQSCQEQAEAAVNLFRENSDMFIEKSEKDYFNAKQNALAVKYAERHYRAMAQPGGNSWNERVAFKKQTINNLLQYHGEDAKIIVWAHNTHIGDARATAMRASGMENIGQLTRERYGENNVVIVGFGTFTGQVLAGSQWGSHMQTMNVPDAMTGSIERIFNELDYPTSLTIFDGDIPEQMLQPLGNRAIGVVYNPANERGNYVPTVMPRRYDAFIFIKETTPLIPLPAALTN